ncbi:MAG: DUF3050 domain-containing protein [Planctomycetes bacterium]|nr:DUF3050 domain-containing protein [Planctomycetota bacterium]
MPAPRTYDALESSLAPLRAELVAHPLYGSLATLDDVRCFQERHVFAVWDFMSLLKSLQRAVTCVDVPWTPRADRLSARLINEIVLGEESDDAPGGGYTSHFELYRAAMEEAGADTRRVDAFVGRIRLGATVEDALERAETPLAARRFVLDTFATLRTHSLPRIAAAFTLGREDVIPDMFVRLVDDLSRDSGGRLALFREYLERHIHLDGERHGPMAKRLLEHVCGDDEHAWSEAHAGARDALRSRIQFWTDVRAALSSNAVNSTTTVAAARS